MAVNAELYLRPGAAGISVPRSVPDSASPASVDRLGAPLADVPIAVTELSAAAAQTDLAVVAPITPTALWQGLLPELERQLGPELPAFRKRMLAGRIPPDYENDMFPGRRSGAWAIYRDIRAVEGRPDVEFCLFVRRGKDQLAVWEGTGIADSLRANFATVFPGPTPGADAVRRGFAAALVRHGIATDR